MEEKLIALLSALMGEQTNGLTEAIKGMPEHLRSPFLAAMLLDGVAEAITTWPKQDRLISLARTDMQSAANWLSRYCSDNS